MIETGEFRRSPSIERAHDLSGPIRGLIARTTELDALHRARYDSHASGNGAFIRLGQMHVQNMVAKDPLRVVDLNPAAVTLEELAEGVLALTSGEGPHETSLSVSHDEDKLILNAVHPGCFSSAAWLLAVPERES